MSNKLIWNVYVEDPNLGDIKLYNVLNTGIVEEIKNRTLGTNDKEQFAEEVKSVLMYHYWSRSEWEIVLTDWVPHITIAEFDRLADELEGYRAKWDKNPYKLFVNLATSKKVDVWDQVQLNWNHFIDYIWNNLKVFK